MQSHFLENIYENLFYTGASFAVICLIYAILYIFYVRKIESVHHKQKVRIRLFYVACVLFLFFMAHVWVDGFTHLLTILGLVSAALVVSNKELIMNFVGWLVITWRGLFAEDDLIQIVQYKGYVKRIGILYIMLYEVSEGLSITGRVIRVPNGMVSNNALINFSQNSHLLEQRFSLLVSSDNDFAQLKNDVKTEIEKVVDVYYKDKREFTAAYLSKKNKQLSSHLRMGAKISLHPKGDNLTTIELVARYFCFSEDAEKIQEAILMAILKLLKDKQEIKVA